MPQRLRLLRLLPLAALLSAFAVGRPAHAADERCDYGTSVGKACVNAGPKQDQPGICQSVPCSSLDGGPDDVVNCTVCNPDTKKPSGTCSGATAGDPTTSFASPLGGCCSVAGAHSMATGAGLLAATVLLGLAFAVRRRRRRLRG
jgi:hypothetical protein